MARTSRIQKALSIVALGATTTLYQNCTDFTPTRELGLSSSNSLFESSTTKAITAEKLSASCQATKDNTEPTSIRLLSNIEYTNTVLAFLYGPYNYYYNIMRPGVESYLSLLPDDAAPDGISAYMRFNKSNTQMSAERLNQYHLIAFQASQNFINNPSAATYFFYPLNLTCYNGDSTTQDCMDKIIRAKGNQAFRRPISDDEFNAAKAVAALGATRAEQIGNVLYYFMMSPDFFYHMETSGTLAGDVLTLDQYAIASRISYLLTATPPDATLTAKAAAGELGTRAGVEAAVDYIRTTYPQQVKDYFWEFTKEWLRPPTAAFNVTEAFKSEAQPNFDATTSSAAVRTEMLKDLRAMFEYYVFNNGTYYDLFTNQKSFTSNAVVASLYGSQPMTGSTPTDMPTDERAGFMTTADMLTPGGSISNPFRTGGTFHKHVICRQFAGISDPNQLPGISEATGTLKSTRELYEALVPRPSSCMGCHTAVDAVGMPFQDYDPLGRHRHGSETVYKADGTVAGVVAVDARATPMIADKEKSVNGAVALVRQFAMTTEPEACFARQYFRFANARMEEQRDVCVISRFADKLTTGSIWDAIKEMAADEWFLKRKLD